MRAILLALLAAAALTAGCGTGDLDGAPTSGPEGLLLKVESLPGGSRPYRLPPYIALALYEDGRVLVPGPQIEIYPGPVLPELQESRLSSEALESLLDDVRATGVLEAGSGDPPAPGAGGLVVTAFLDGERTVVALDAANQKLGELLAQIPVTGERPYEPEALAVFAAPLEELPVPPDGEIGPKPVTLDWPAGALSAGCQVVRGTELEALLPVARRAHELTFWRSGGALHTVAFRPLVPGESTCADIGL
ncbi:MAG: hypothetical protein ACRDON_01900 [Gaiellaceae bacterium]